MDPDKSHFISGGSDPGLPLHYHRKRLAHLRASHHVAF